MIGGEVLVDTRDGIRTITLHRPDKRNALSRAMRDELIRVCRAVDHDPAVAAVVLTGTDPAFSAGVDLGEIGAGLAADAVPGTLPAAERAAATAGGNPAAALRAVRTPVIAAVNGACFTGALEIALSCDVIVASEAATFGDTHARFGILPFWGMSALLPERVGTARARDMSLTGRTVAADEAIRIGLVEHVVPHDELLPYARALAADVVAADRTAVLGVQDLYDHGAGRPLDERLAREAEVALAHDFDLAAFEARRQTRFSGTRP
jgi:enoyl-CoA hydratase/carnithine racemase